MCLDFLSVDKIIYKIPQVIALCACFVSFYILVKELFNSRKFALFCGISSLLLLPLSFEYTLPNTFNFYGVGTTLCILSLWLFVKYIKEGAKKHLYLAMVLQFLSEISYEMFVTLVPIYCLIAVLYNYSNKQKIFKNVNWPIMIGIIFLVLYIAARIVFPSHYDGTEMKFDVESSIHVILVLFQAVLPFFYTYCPYYQDVLNENSFPDSLFSWIRLIGILLIVITVFVIYSIRGSRNDIKDSNEKEMCRYSENKKSFFVVAIAIFTIILPMIPTAISAKYQAIVGVYIPGFYAQPCSFISFFAVTFIICYVIWTVNKRISKSRRYKKRFFVGAVTLVLFVSILGSVQYTNEIYYNVQVEDYDRLCYIEDFVRSDELNDFSVDEYYCVDFYKQQHLMYYYNSPNVWTIFSENCGNGIKITSTEASIEDNRIYLPDDMYFQVWHNGIPTIISKYEIPGTIDLIVVDGETIDVKTINIVQNASGWYVADVIF